MLTQSVFERDDLFDGRLASPRFRAERPNRKGGDPTGPPRRPAGSSALSGDNLGIARAAFDIRTDPAREVL